MSNVLCEMSKNFEIKFLTWLTSDHQDEHHAMSTTPGACVGNLTTEPDGSSLSLRKTMGVRESFSCTRPQSV